MGGKRVLQQTLGFKSQALLPAGCVTLDQSTTSLCPFNNSFNSWAGLSTQATPRAGVVCCI